MVQTLDSSLAGDTLLSARPSAPALAVLRALEAGGLEAWFVGGWVRDALMGAPSHDIDICCSGSWQESKRALEAASIAVVESGTRFGGITAVVDGERVEVTSYRYDGFYTDGSFVQHGNFSYTGGYGLSMLDEVTKLMLIMRGSRFDFIEENVKNQYDWLFNSYATVIYDGNFFASTRGREVDRNTSESSAQRSAVSSMIEMTTYAPAEIKGRLESLIRYYMLATEYNYANDVPLMLIDYAVGLYGNSDVSPREGYELVKVFGNMDRVVQHGPEYGVCLSLSSTRIFKYEAINNENMDGWYQGDGMIYIYTDGYDYNYSFFNYVDPYKLPGTTVSTATRTVENISGST